MKTVLAFDVYGTLIDTHGLLSELSEMVGDKAEVFSHTWRNKQLEYSFRRGLMRCYQHFSVCTAQALDFTCQHLGITLQENQRQLLLDKYLRLPAFSDVQSALPELAKTTSLVAFSNGEQQAVNSLLSHAGIAGYFEYVVTADAIETFKPDPAIYRHFLDTVKCDANQTWLVSSNPFDVIGASECGWRTAWVKRSPQSVFDPWDITPTAEISALGQLAPLLKNTV